MKISKIQWSIIGLLLLTPIFIQANPGEEEPKKKKKKLLYVYPVNDDAAWLDFQNGGYNLLTFFPTKVIGVYKVDSAGFRFTPATVAPEGMMPQEHFEKFYKLNPLVKEVFIPYGQIMSVKSYAGYTIRTKDGKKYHFRSKKAKAIVREIRAHITQ